MASAEVVQEKNTCTSGKGMDARKGVPFGGAHRESAVKYRTLLNK